MGMSPLPPVLARALADYRTRLRARYGPRLADVRLFGPWARGEAHADSDVDVLVLIDGAHAARAVRGLGRARPGRGRDAPPDQPRDLRDGGLGGHAAARAGVRP